MGGPRAIRQPMSSRGEASNSSSADAMQLCDAKASGDQTPVATVAQLVPLVGERNRGELRAAADEVEDESGGDAGNSDATSGKFFLPSRTANLYGW
jgi:hypothetical protein